MAKTRTQNLSASLEDYLEAILNITGAEKVARSKDIAEVLGVTKSSVTGALKLLVERGLVNYKPYGYVTLTKSGLVEAQRIARKHEIIKSFFVNVLSVEDEVAQMAACKAEHAFGPKVVSRLVSFMNFIDQYNDKGRDLTREFKKFCQ